MMDRQENCGLSVAGRELSNIELGDTISFERKIRVGKPEYEGGPPTGSRVSCHHVAQITGDVITITLHRPDSNGSIEQVVYSGKRMPPLPPKPDLSKVTFGQPIELFNGRNLDGWKLTNADRLTVGKQ